MNQLINWLPQHIPADESQAIGHGDFRLDNLGRPPVSHGECNYHLAFNLFRLSSITQGIASRALQGNAASAAAVEAGKLARPVAEAGRRLSQSAT
jgi:hypothetical protein